MADSYLSTKFGFNSLYGFRENAFYGRTDDGRSRHGIIAKNGEYFFLIETSCSSHIA